VKSDVVKSGAVNRRRLVLCLLAVGVLLAFAARVLLGDFTVTIPDLFRIIGGAEIPGATFIVMETKLPRAVLGVLVGLAFGLAGAVFQTSFRNPLASPDIVGVSTGASAAAVVAIVLLDLRGAAVAVVAVIGALACSLLVRLVAGGTAPHRLVLAGIAVSAGLLSVIQYVFTRADVWDAQLVLRWLTGSLGTADWPTIRVTLIALVVLVPLVALLSRSLRILELGDDTAAGLGVPVRHRDLALLLGVVLVGVGVAAAGPIAFVAFMAGPMARLMLGGRTSLVGAALVGAAVVVSSDYVADYLLSDTNFPVGVVTGALGAPFLLWLLASGATSRRLA
jgi:iron complex transport system permease protein